MRSLAFTAAAVVVACHAQRSEPATITLQIPPAQADAAASSSPAATLPETSASVSPLPPAPTDATRDAKIRATFGARCRFERMCGNLWGIDCEAAVDGPYYYVKPDSLEIVSRCGGYCMGGHCTNCPPSEWKCKTY